MARMRRRLANSFPSGRRRVAARFAESRTKRSQRQQPFPIRRSWTHRFHVSNESVARFSLVGRFPLERVERESFRKALRYDFKHGCAAQLLGSCQLTFGSGRANKPLQPTNAPSIVIVF